MAESALRSSALGDLSATPRVWVFMALTTIAAMASGALGVARIVLATESFGNAIGIGSMAIIYGLAAVIMCLPSGMITDRFSARAVFVTSLLILSLVQARLSIIASLGTLAPSELFANSAIEGVMTGFVLASLAKVQASLVSKDARGSAEVINLLRIAIGGLMGTLLAGALDRPALVMALGAATNAIVAVGVGLVSRTTRSSLAGTVAGSDLRAAWRGIRASHPLQVVVVVDLILRLVIPTQVISLFIADEHIVDLAGVLISLGIVGVLIGQFALAIRGVHRAAGRPVLVTFVAASVISGAATFTLWTGWLLQSSIAIAVCVLSYSALTAFCQGTVAALVQQRCPDDIRGRVSAALGGVRALFVTIAVAVGSLIMARWHLPGMSLAITGLMVLALAAIRGITWFQTSQDEADLQRPQPSDPDLPIR